MQFTGITITGGTNALPTTNVPDAPTIGTATSTGANSATVAFTAPSSNGNSTIISYTAISTPGNITGTLVQSGSGTITVTGLVPSTSYTFKVIATNSIGNSATSSASNSITTSAPTINIYSWGINNYYQLGLTDTVNRSSPTQIGSSGDWNRLAVGYRYTLATKNNGALWAVGGRADNGGFGLGSSIGYVSSPIQVGALTTWANVGVGYYTSTAIKTDGTLWSWGQFASGPLNGGATGLVGVSSPVIVGSDTDWVDIFQTISFGLGIKTDNSLWAWGDNTYGQLGTNSSYGANSPIQVGNDTNWLNIGGGSYNALATRTDGTMWTWGNNTSGELGTNSVILRSSPVQVGVLTNWSKIVKSSNGFFVRQTSVFATKTNGTLWGWGNNVYGSIGDNTTINRSSPVQIGTDTTWNNVTTSGLGVDAASKQFTIANKTDGTLWSWGGNGLGELGQNDLIDRSSPTQVGSATTWVNTPGSGEKYSMAINGSKTAPGVPTILNAEPVSATSVRVGVAVPIVSGVDDYITYTATSTPGGFTGTLTNKAGGGGIVVSNLVPGISYTFTVTATNSVGTSAASSASTSVTPVDIPNPNLLVYGWGNNQYGELGLNDTVDRSSPTQTGYYNNTWTRASAGGGGEYSAMIANDGTLWTTGYNSYGQLGLNNTTSSSNLMQVGADTDWYIVSTGGGSNGTSKRALTLAIKSNGTLWSWGDNDLGQLGLNDLITRSSPTQIGTDTNWINISVGQECNGCALKNDGTLWVWGKNLRGQLGNNSGANKSSPIQVGTDTNWASMANGDQLMLATKTNGTLWSWGDGASGALGLNNTGISRSSPVQVGTDTDWKSVAAGSGYSFALKTDNTLWAWGLNSSGQLGINSTVSKSSPVQVGTSSWTMVRIGAISTGAIMIDGTLWTWGANNQGQLGLNNRTSKSSPTQVGTDTNWIEISTNVDTYTFSYPFFVAIKGTPAKPASPTNVVATALGSSTVTGGSTASITFNAPSDNGSDIFQYTVTSSPGNIKAYSFKYASITISGLDSNTSYTFTVTATNSVGESLPSSASNSITTPYAITPTVEYLVVAGGGGGGTYRGGGAGGGGINYSPSVNVSESTTYTITVGSGGTGVSSTTQAVGANGSNSSISGSEFTTVTSLGGGGGGGGTLAGLAGGAGGGGGTSGADVASAGGAGTSGQGNNGGAGAGTAGSTGSSLAGGGGGSANATNSGGAGGAGGSYSITGTATYYAGGGGGSAGTSAGGGTGGLGGLGGGGTGASYPTRGTSGTTNTGGGAGGTWFGEGANNGGSGIVIIRYADTYKTATSTTGSPTVTVAGGYRVYKFTSSGSITL